MARVYVRGEGSPGYKHGYAARGQKKPGCYGSWEAMRQRCLNKKNEKYHVYGGRGITICTEWNSFETFYQWALSSGWEAGLTIDRIDGDKGYFPNNCRWVTNSENAKNKKPTRMVGSKNARTTLDDKKALEIFNSKEDGVVIGKKYGISKMSVSNIKRKKTWSHIHDVPKEQTPRG